MPIAEKIYRTLIELWAEQNGYEVESIEFKHVDDADHKGGHITITA